MLDSISLDHLRIFIAAADEGSFSAGGRRLRRTQSVVSQTLANLEAQLGVKLFDRSKRAPILTAEGAALLSEARGVAGKMDALKARAKSLAGGLEAELNVVVDAMFPMERLTPVMAEFQAEFPEMPLQLHVAAPMAVLRPVLEGTSSIGVMASRLAPPPQVTRERLLTIRWVFVASRDHPLALLKDPIPASVFERHRQLVLTDDFPLLSGNGIDFCIASANTWRLSDLRTKHAFLRAGLGWGGMPIDAIRDDLASGTLVIIRREDLPDSDLFMPIHGVFRSDRPPGPAARWLIECIKSLESHPFSAVSVRGLVPSFLPSRRALRTQPSV